ncbi:MAG: hypothetical protein IKY89_05500 [Alistipes sp.]|nr:hypothetical protein [Alistipes sp.]
MTKRDKDGRAMRRECDHLCGVCSKPNCSREQQMHNRLAEYEDLMEPNGWRDAENPPKERGLYIVKVKGAEHASAAYYNPLGDRWTDWNFWPLYVEKWQPLPQI